MKGYLPPLKNFEKRKTAVCAHMHIQRLAASMQSKYSFAFEGACFAFPQNYFSKNYFVSENMCKFVY